MIRILFRRGYFGIWPKLTNSKQSLRIGSKHTKSKLIRIDLIHGLFRPSILMMPE